MAVRRNPVHDAERRARRQLAELVRDLRDARHAVGLSQATVAGAIGVSHQLISQWERGVLAPGFFHAARWGAAVCMDVTLRAYPGGAPLRDAGHLRLLARARASIGEAWRWRTEVPVSADPRDRRAFDVALERDKVRIGLEIITRLTNAQAQVRAALLKQEAARMDRMMLVLGKTRHNRAAVRAAMPSLLPAFPLASRTVLRELRQGNLPMGNALILL